MLIPTSVVKENTNMLPRLRPRLLVRSHVADKTSTFLSITKLFAVNSVHILSVF